MPVSLLCGGVGVLLSVTIWVIIRLRCRRKEVRNRLVVIYMRVLMRRLSSDWRSVEFPLLGRALSWHALVEAIVLLRSCLNVECEPLLRSIVASSGLRRWLIRQMALPRFVNLRLRILVARMPLDRRLSLCVLGRDGSVSRREEYARLITRVGIDPKMAIEQLASPDFRLTSAESYELVWLLARCGGVHLFEPIFRANRANRARLALAIIRRFGADDFAFDIARLAGISNYDKELLPILLSINSLSCGNWGGDFGSLRVMDRRALIRRAVAEGYSFEAFCGVLSPSELNHFRRLSQTYNNSALCYLYRA